MQQFVDIVGGYVWSTPLIALALGAGLLFSILTRFVQVRLFREMVALLFSNKSSDKGISSFQALAVSLSGRVGTGNIAGVAAAIGFGGPGAVFWMWVVAFLGAATAYIESTLGQIYKEVDEGQYRGGPAYYIEKAMGQKWYAWLFAITTILATGFLLPGVQANAITSSAEVALGTGAMVDTAIGADEPNQNRHRDRYRDRFRAHHFRRRQTDCRVYTDHRSVHGAGIHHHGLCHCRAEHHRAAGRRHVDSHGCVVADSRVRRHGRLGR